MERFDFILAPKIENGATVIDSNQYYYVYALIDPSDDTIFYIGKGCNGRVYDHIAEAKRELERNPDNLKSEKIKRIIKILDSTNEVELVFLRTGLTENEAYEVEGMMIDFLKWKDYGFVKNADVKNIQNGHNNDVNGIKNILGSKILSVKDDMKINEKEKIMAISINNSYFSRGGDVYQSVRYCWHVVPSRAKKAEYILAVLYGVVVGVYEKAIWQKAKNRPQGEPDRYEFDAVEVVDPAVRNRFYLKRNTLTFGTGNPIRYNYK